MFVHMEDFLIALCAVMVFEFIIFSFLLLRTFRINQQLDQMRQRVEICEKFAHTIWSATSGLNERSNISEEVIDSLLKALFDLHTSRKHRQDMVARYTLSKRTPEIIKENSAAQGQYLKAKDEFTRYITSNRVEKSESKA